ncbi:hypothetical protein TW95_gp0434 [Pandoravirus inopinatum]|uniref:Uncharacterized protein n=1 Tax=Pandoravirus inopinatum TaxID=1605721 RepID=A0A0B5IWV6_9VIRU|nr:hypothetical protein TW95_gp0434 [Pandoravirus inopinatum]AJF97168.1 hypothetical protein [Pandoravirus inopinatum]
MTALHERRPKAGARVLPPSPAMRCAPIAPIFWPGCAIGAVRRDHDSTTSVGRPRWPSRPSRPEPRPSLHGSARARDQRRALQTILDLGDRTHLIIHGGLNRVLLATAVSNLITLATEQSVAWMTTSWWPFLLGIIVGYVATVMVVTE